MGFDKTGRAVETNDQAARDFRVKRSAVASFFNPAPDQSLRALSRAPTPSLPQHPLYPRYNLMTGGIRRFVEVDDTGGDVGFEVTLERGASAGDWDKVAGSDEN